jgi:hypothetical protein
MNPRVLICALGLLVAAGGAQAAGEQTHHDHGAAPQAALKLDNGKKWATDEPLRRGMVNIREQLEHLHHGKPDPAAYDRLAKAVNGEVAYIFQNCRLPKQADDVLHVVLADVMQGAAALEGKQKDMSREQGANRIVHALDNYGRYFDHPGWQPPRH